MGQLRFERIIIVIILLRRQLKILLQLGQVKQGQLRYSPTKPEQTRRYLEHVLFIAQRLFLFVLEFVVRVVEAVKVDELD